MKLLPLLGRLGMCTVLFASLVLLNETALSRAAAPEVLGTLGTQSAAFSIDARGSLTAISQPNQGGQPNIGLWDKANEWASWQVRFPRPGVYRVTASVASISGQSEFNVDVAGQQLSAKPEKSAGWDQFKNITLGQVEIKQAGDQTLSVRPKSPASWHAMNLRAVHLTPAE